MRRMKAGSRNVSASRARKSAGQMAEDEEEAVLRAVNKDDPSAPCSANRGRPKSSVSAHPPPTATSLTGTLLRHRQNRADLRQEQLACS